MIAPDEPKPSRFIFWSTAPFLVATILLLPMLVRPPQASGWATLAVCEVLAIFVFLGLYDSARFWWCWRCVGAIVFGGYFVYFVFMVMTGQIFADDRRLPTTAVNALMGLVIFGFPGLMYALLGRFSWRSHCEPPSDSNEWSDGGDGD